ncbi:MAG: thioredoxin domain-containing protein [Thermoleophilia bacterium]
MSRNGWLIGGAVVAVVAIVVALIVVSVSGGDSSSEPTASEIRGADAVVALTKGLPQDGFAIGKPGAPVTVREFIDPQCPVCKSASEDITPAVITGPVKDGTARLIIEPLTFLGPDSSTAAIAIAAAAEQDRGFAFTEILYANQGEENKGWVTEDLLTGIAGSTPGLDTAAWNTARSGDASGDQLFAVADRATANGVNATPTFIITGPGGKEVIAGAKDADEVLAAIEAVR